MMAQVQDLHNQRLYWLSSLYYLGKVQFSSPNPFFWRVQRITPVLWILWSSLRSSGQAGILSSCAGDDLASSAVRV
jgi:hypothetical protein